ncbi:LamB/YcsF family protein [Cryobacterium sp. TMT1-62]|uniref:LamB/YcsF family protein n=1 Tax=unclassified Cryobacterium TaxID=2649013 RepID=UPI001069F677|nr:MULTISPECIES: 5-oxoprolinase subunit PxpA [unclassified Cryobacterium]TFB55099.1 LamB/YcsF family protein [Cryobacterium sp. Sr3]TFB64001.1 LamB/YcsF family protein [Cryobacterium sp. Hz7]TFC36303.1 LamB/YcsF family protein [Cryobacterium sp. TMT2-14]TFC52453.1 LamB/YcsF family protein [Cryobacterium sp. TMT2-17-1]TFC65229.1 LamB/YcsF family protein [Cryobacterium sp. TMT2-4]
MSSIDSDSIDLNSDVGESFGNWSFGDDAAIISSVSSVNVACAFHAGDPSTIRATCTAAAAAGVTVGAHPGYRDLAGFGRRFIDMEPGHLTDEVIYQIGALQALAAVAGTRVSYVKPHGALYNTIAHDEVQAQAVVDAIRAVDPSLPVMVLPDSEIQRLADAAGLRTVVEAFADRAYNSDGSLVSRSRPGAVLLHPDAVTEQALRLAGDRQVRTVDGSLLTVTAESICLHGDTPGAVALVGAVRSALQDAGIRIRSFV